MRTRSKHLRPSFTLVELLVVIAIIGILVALISAAAAGALRTAKEAAILTEVQQLAGAIERYKSDYGAYPPDFSNANAVERHIRKRFPRIDNGEVNTIKSLSLTPAQALVFWLQGFKPDPAFPKSGAGQREPLYDFDKSRLVNVNNGPYLPPYGQYDGSTPRPYVYFNALTYANVSFQSMKPYLSDNASDTYVKSDSFQLLSAGLDAKWGNTGSNASYPSGDNYTKEDRDNLANFSNKNLENSKP